MTYDFWLDMYTWRIFPDLTSIIKQWISFIKYDFDLTADLTMVCI